MGLPSQPVTLSVEQLDELNRNLSSMRHDVNNHLSLIMAALEMMRFKPDSAPRMLDSLAQQPSKITLVMTKFSEQFEQTFGITRP